MQIKHKKILICTTMHKSMERPDTVCGGGSIYPIFLRKNRQVMAKPSHQTTLPHSYPGNCQTHAQNQTWKLKN